MIAAEESDNGGAPATYQEPLFGPEGKGWQIAFDAKVKDSPLDDPGKARIEKCPYRQDIKLIYGCVYTPYSMINSKREVNKNDVFSTS